MIEALFSFSDVGGKLSGELRFVGGQILTLDHGGVQQLMIEQNWTHFDLVAHNDEPIWLEQQFIGKIARKNRETEKKDTAIYDVDLLRERIASLEEYCDGCKVAIIEKQERLACVIDYRTNDWDVRLMALKEAIVELESTKAILNQLRNVLNIITVTVTED